MGAGHDQLIDHALLLYDHVFRALEARDVVTFCHGYDYAIPNGQTWLGKPMEERGIVEPGFQREIVRVMVDNFNARLGRLSARFPKVRFIDMRNAVGDGRWYDELHPTKEGYAAVAERFHEGSNGSERPSAARGAPRRPRQARPVPRRPPSDAGSGAASRSTSASTP